MWLISYSPTATNNLTRMHELHKITEEFHYLYARGLMRAYFFVFLFALVMYKATTSWGWLKYGNQDSLEISMRDIHAMRNE